VTGTISSAEPEKLLRYSDLGLQLDGEIAAESTRLAGRLQQFEGSCTEPGCRVDVAYHASTLSSQGREGETLGEWVRNVARGFLLADSGSVGPGPRIVWPWLPPDWGWPGIRPWPPGIVGPIIGPRWLGPIIIGLPWWLPKPERLKKLLARAQEWQFNQFEADTINADCGPTSLVMLLYMLGLSMPGQTAGMNIGELIDLARRTMVTDPARDGVDEKGNRADGEHSTNTDFDDLERGAEAAGAKCTNITADARAIRESLERGEPVIVSGTFAGKQPLPWTGDRGKDKDNSRAPGGAAEHIVAVTGYDPVTQMFIINDPARNSPVAVSATQLESFMSGNAGALALSRA